MIDPEDIRELLEARPFQPFRVHMADGNHYDLTNPNLIVAMQSKLFVAFSGDRWTFLSYPNMASIESIGGASDDNHAGMLPVQMIETRSRLRNISKALLEELGREPTIEEIARKAKMPVSEARCVMKISRHPISLDRPVGDEILDETLKARIEKALEALSDREREILKLRYGIGDGYTHTLEEVGKIFQLSRERVRQIEAKAIRKLQHPVRARKLEAMLNGLLQSPDVPSISTKS